MSLNKGPTGDKGIIGDDGPTGTPGLIFYLSFFEFLLQNLTFF